MVSVVADAVALVESLVPVLDIVPLSVPVVLLPVVEGVLPVVDGRLSVDGVVPIEPLRVSSVVVADEDPVVLPLLCVLVAPVLLVP